MLRCDRRRKLPHGNCTQKRTDTYRTVRAGLRVARHAGRWLQLPVWQRSQLSLGHVTSSMCLLRCFYCYMTWRYSRPLRSLRESDKSALSDTVPLRAPLTTVHRQPFASCDCNPNVCTPDDCEPFCEPYDCTPDLPPCKPTTLCLPNFIPPYPPCSPDTCNPDACNPNKLPE